MKLNTKVLVLSCLAASLIGFAQEDPAPSPGAAPPTNAPPPAKEAEASPPPASGTATNDAATATATNTTATVTNDTATATPAAGVEVAGLISTNAPVTSTNAPSRRGEVVPLIVIDEVPLTDAIRNLARQSNLNFQFDPKLTTSNQPIVTIRFENVTAEEALEAVLDNYNLQLVQDPKSKIARISTKVPKAEEPLYSRIVQLKYSEPTNMVVLVKSTLSPRSLVLADSRTSQIILTTTLKEFDGAIALIEKLDTPTKQVLIEARLLETAQAPTSIKGIDWSGTLEAQQFRAGNNTFTPGEKISNNLLVPDPNLDTRAAKLLVGPGRGFSPTTAFLDADGLSAVLSFLNKDTETEVVATPRAVTLDNQTAQLAVTRAFPIFQITPGSANTPAGAQIQYTNLGVILRVTPRIAADNNISLKVVPEVSNIDGKDQQTINNTINIANIYAIRRIETQVLIPSGNTLVMGGLINDTRSKSFVKVPLLGDIPAIGLAFRKEEKRRNKTNLLIFITPTIIEDEAFQLTDSGKQFLKTRMVDTPEPKETAWDSAKPHDWTKPVY